MLFFIIGIVDAPFYVDARKGDHLCLGEVISQIKFTKKIKTIMVSQFFNTIMALPYCAPQRL